MKQQTGERPLQQPLVIIYSWVDGQMRRADKGEDRKREECGECKRAAETNDGWEGWKLENDRAEQMQQVYLWWMETITTITVLQQRLEGRNEYKWEDLRSKSEDCVCLVPVWSFPPLLRDTESLKHNLPQGHKHLNASLQWAWGFQLLSRNPLGAKKLESLRKKSLISI